MKKKIIALLLTLVMVIGIVPAAVFAADPAPKATFTYVPDKTEANPGEIINYTLTLEWDEPIQGLVFRPVFPTGLEYVAGSGAIDANAKTALSFNEVAWTESTKVISGYGDYVVAQPSDEPFVLFTFQAKVLDTAAAGEYEMDYDADKMELVDADYEMIDTACVNASKVNVKLEPLSTWTLTADKTTVTRGEVITYTLALEWQNGMQGLVFRPTFPTGLEYVTGSGAVDANAKSAINFNEVAWTDSTKVLSGYGDYAVEMPSADALVLMTFQAKVADDAAFGEYEVGSDMDKIEVVDAAYDSHPVDRIEFITPTITVIDHKCTADMLALVEAVDPDCTTAGNIAYYECSECGLLYKDANAEEAIAAEDVIVAANGHTDGEWVETTAPACTEDGEKTLSCAVCGEVLKTEVIPATGHSYESVVTPPTCVDKGYTTWTCSVCGESYIDTYVDPTGHTDGEWIETTAPTCTEKGEETLYCAVCNEALDTREVDALGHTDGEWKNTTAPTCTEVGEDTLYCAVCNVAIDTREAAATGHTEEEIPAVAPTCTQTGLTAGTKCSVCDEVLEAPEVVPANGHTDGEWVNTTAPTCTEKGEDTLYCAVCQEAIDTREVAATGHSYVSVVTAPTCTEDGYTTWTCSVCSDTYTDTTVPAIGHNEPAYEDWTEDPNAPGHFYAYCTNGCGTILNEDIRTVFVTGVKLSQDYVDQYYVRSAPAFTLTAKVTPADASEKYTVTWTSSDESIVTVDEDGNVTTHKRGSAVVTATVTSEDGKTTFSASCTVKVKYNWWQWLIWIFLFGCFWYFI